MTTKEFVSLFQGRRLDEILNDLPSIINQKWPDDHIFLTMLTSDDVIIARPGIQHIFISEPDFSFTIVPFIYRNGLRFERGYKYLDNSNEKYAVAYSNSVEAGNSITFEHIDGELKISTTFTSTEFYIYRGDTRVPALIFNKKDIKVPAESMRLVES